MLSLDEVLHSLGGLLVEPPPRLEVAPSFQGAAIDSRQVAKGDLFFALRGEKDDGHRHIRQALARGAVGVVAEHWPEPWPDGGPCLILVKDSLAALQALAHQQRERYHPLVIGVTGSVGKTTTKDAIAAVLGQRYRVLKTAGNLNTEVGLPLSLLRLEVGHTHTVLEMGTYGLGEIAALCRLARPEVGVVTNVGPIHLERLGSIDNVARAKAELVEGLPPQGWALLNGDDSRVRAMAGSTKAQVLTYGLSPECQVRASHIESHGLQGVSFTLGWGDEAFPVSSRLAGHHNVYAALAAAAVGLSQGLTRHEVVAGLQSVASPRLRILPGRCGSTIIDDTYNANPPATLAALALLAEMGGRKVAVLGDMLELGAYEEEGHRLVGRRAAEVADVLLVAGPRARVIGEEALECGLSQVAFASDLEAAATLLEASLRPGDFILIKGSRAMAMERLVERLQP